MYYVYVQENEKGLWYKGYTSNIIRRRVEHLLQRTPYSKRFGPSRLIYYEVLENKTKAIQREKFLKSGQGRLLLRHITGATRRDTQVAEEAALLKL